MKRKEQNLVKVKNDSESEGFLGLAYWKAIDLRVSQTFVTDYYGRVKNRFAGPDKVRFAVIVMPPINDFKI